MPRIGCMLAVVIALAGVSGCHRPVKSYPVKGKVIYQQSGQPLPAGGIITLVSRGKPVIEASTRIDAAGNFALEGEGVPVGEYKVRIDPELPDDPQSSLDPRAARARLLNARYSDAETSGLAVTVEPKDNYFTIELPRP